jgi:hypothetical protein
MVVFMAASKNMVPGPGFYTNKRGEQVQLMDDRSNDMFVDNQGRYYTRTGVCMFWSHLNERFLMNTDHRTDLIFGKDA